MARPRVFISSTYFDLKTIRDDIDRFVREKGFEAIRHERGQIAYGREEQPEKYSYREIEFCDILVCIVGGKYGSVSSSNTYSITQKELKTAFELGKQVYIFVERSVHYEYRVWHANKDNKGVKFTAVDNPKIYEFLEEIYALPRGNPIFEFDIAADIANLLEEQWAGLFQRLLMEESTKSQTTLIGELQNSLQTVGKLVEFLTEARDQGDAAIQQILFSNHPMFGQLKRLFKNNYRIYFQNIEELDEWLLHARSYERVKEENWDSPKIMEWARIHDLKKGKEQRVLRVSKSVFGQNGDLKVINASNWQDDWVTLTVNPSIDQNKIVEDDIPF
ncbi:MAG TPA: DUF4062 domain-containing protein [Burkholderiales bacterium]|nr:DUF4062 domain-containing protein [Burkholderiales bacterium]